MLRKVFQVRLIDDADYLCEIKEFNTYSEALAYKEQMMSVYLEPDFHFFILEDEVEDYEDHCC